MIVVITGASSGIGLETANYLAEKGYTVYGLSRRKVETQKFTSIQCDVTDFIMIENALKSIFETEGKIDVLINNAGMGIAGAIENTNMDDIRKQFELNLFALINACKCVTPLLRKNGGGKIVNISSVAGVIPIPFQTCYATSKAAVDMFSMSFGLEIKDFNIKVISVMPGDTKTSFTDNRIKNNIMADEFYGKRIAKSIAKMEQDERGGKPPITVSKVIYRALKKKNPKSRITVGFSYKLIVFLAKILPRKIMLFVVKLLYG